MIFDTHMHCDFSTDSSMTLEEAIAAAEKENIGMIVTEHWDYDYPTNPTEFIFDLNAYYDKMCKFRSDKVLIGIEIGMQAHTIELDKNISASHEFDFVLGSIHCMKRKDLYEEYCYEGLTRQEAVRDFLEDSIYCITHNTDYDAFAHIDYLTRYWIYKGEYLEYADAPELFDELFKILANGNKAIEINTRRLDDQKAIDALVPLYKRFAELGGKYCTLGSDAHYAEHVGRRMDVALAIARECGLTPVYFKKRQIQIIEA